MKTLEDLFKYRFVNPATNCWLWTAAKDKDGYGVTRLNGKIIKSSQSSFYFNKWRT